MRLVHFMGEGHNRATTLLCLSLATTQTACKPPTDTEGMERKARDTFPSKRHGHSPALPQFGHDVNCLPTTSKHKRQEIKLLSRGMRRTRGSVLLSEPLPWKKIVLKRYFDRNMKNLVFYT